MSSSMFGDETPLPLVAETLEKDDALFEDDPWVDGTIRMDYGYNVKYGPGSISLGNPPPSPRPFD